MEELLHPYKRRGTFIFNKEESLSKKCNAPVDAGGIYLVFDTKANSIIYIGSSGWVCNNGNFEIRDGGMCARIVKGKQFDSSRKKSWPAKMIEQGIEEIRVDWFVTYNDEVKHIPAFVEASCVQKYFEKHDYLCLPRWNVEY